jgi:hypothetical protein
MTPLEWRALVDAYVGGRLSADTFKRRFVEAFEAAVAERASVPRSVQELYFTVEAYGGDPMGRGHDVADDAAMAEAARRALGQLAVEPALAQDPRIDEQERAESLRGLGFGAKRDLLGPGLVGGGWLDRGGCADLGIGHGVLRGQGCLAMALGAGRFGVFRLPGGDLYRRLAPMGAAGSLD